MLHDEQDVDMGQAPLLNSTASMCPWTLPSTCPCSWFCCRASSLSLKTRHSRSGLSCTCWLRGRAALTPGQAGLQVMGEEVAGLPQHPHHGLRVWKHLLAVPWSASEAGGQDEAPADAAGVTPALTQQGVFQPPHCNMHMRSQ